MCIILNTGMTSAEKVIMTVLVEQRVILGPQDVQWTVRNIRTQFNAKSFALFTNTPSLRLVRLKMPQQKKGISILRAVNDSRVHTYTLPTKNRSLSMSNVELASFEVNLLTLLTRPTVPATNITMRTASGTLTYDVSLRTLNNLQRPPTYSFDNGRSKVVISRITNPPAQCTFIRLLPSLVRQSKTIL